MPDQPMAPSIVQSPQKWNPNTKRYETSDTHDPNAGAALLAKQKLQDALGLGGNQNASLGDEPKLEDYTQKYGMEGAVKWRADHTAWANQQRKPILARPSPTMPSAQPTPNATPGANPVVGMIQQMLGMGQQNS